MKSIIIAKGGIYHEAKMEVYMKVLTYQKKGALAEKKEMEDRAIMGPNVLAGGFCIIYDLDGGIFAVLDGVGGLTGSAYASTIAARALADIHVPCDPKQIKDTIVEVHHKLVDTSMTATTLTAIYIHDNKVTLFHIGNCRLYGLFAGYIRQITTDQTQYEKMLEQGYIEKNIPDSAKCVITACLGAKQELINDLVYKDISNQVAGCTKLLLSSDGIHDHISVDDLESFLQKDITIDSMTSLFELAYQNGSEDDMTIMVIEK